MFLSGLEWDTEYNVFVVAENQKGKSKPATMSFKTSTQPEAAIPGTPPLRSLTLQTKKPENGVAKLKAHNQNVTVYFYLSSSER